MKRVKLFRTFSSFLILLAVFLTAPLIGVMLQGEPLAPYLMFPPMTTISGSSSFSWIVFIAVLTFVLATTWPFWRRLGSGSWQAEHGKTGSPNRKWPWWGWLALAGVILVWVLAWSRFSWFEPFQRLTFFPLWFSFIVLLNAAAVWLSGRSLLTDRPQYFILLFPVSAMFWWGFEYLNRFVSNWHYQGLEQMGGWQYFWEASLAFSTVLPAVMSVRFMLMQFEVFARSYRDFPSALWLTFPSVWKMTGVVAVLGLILIGWIPRLTYPLVWILPGLLWITWQRWRGYISPMLQRTSAGDYTLLWTSALAALICGFFWELWNIYSEAKWVYSITGLDRFEIFEMPLPGYAGYLPFGVICAVVAQSLLSTLTGDDHAIQEEEETVRLY